MAETTAKDVALGVVAGSCEVAGVVAGLASGLAVAVAGSVLLPFTAHAMPSVGTKTYEKVSNGFSKAGEKLIEIFE